MDIRPITPTYAVSPQISPLDIPAIKAAGFVAILCNRPDAEVPPDLSAASVGAAAVAAGLGFTVIPITHATLSAQDVTAQMAAAQAAGGPVLAYCASGTRSSILWSLGQAGILPTDDIIAATAQAGYDLEGLRPRIDALAKG